MIKFNKHHVVNTETKEKARIYYSLDNRIDNRKCVTLYAKDYTDALGKIFPEYRNDSDSQSDYFEKGRAVLFVGHPLYTAARKAAGAKLQPTRIEP